MRETIKKYVPWAIALLMLLSALWGWFRPAPPTAQHEAAPMPAPSYTYRIPQGYISLEECRIKAYDKAKASEKTKQPDAIAKDDTKQITAIGEVAPYRGTTEVTAVFDMKSGGTELYQRRKPLPFAEFLNEKEIGALYGTGFAAWGTWTFARVGAFHATAGIAGVFKGGESLGVVGAGVAYRW